MVDSMYLYTYIEYIYMYSVYTHLYSTLVRVFILAMHRKAGETSDSRDA